MERSKAERIVLALRGLARANVYEFCRSPRLLSVYWDNFNAGRHKYVADRVTCGLVDCWSTYRALVERYGEKGPILCDCEDASAAHIAALRLGGYPDCLIGFVPGVHISHAICAVRKDGQIIPIDPSVWYGMGPFSKGYSEALYTEV